MSLCWYLAGGHSVMMQKPDVPPGDGIGSMVAGGGQGWKLLLPANLEGPGDTRECQTVVHVEEHLCTPAGRPALGRLHLDLPTALLGAAFAAAGLVPVGPRWHPIPSWPLRPTQSLMKFLFKCHIVLLH